jgi:hypothetical protein
MIVFVFVSRSSESVTTLWRKRLRTEESIDSFRTQILDDERKLDDERNREPHTQQATHT